MNTREARLAAAKAARNTWPAPAPKPVPDPDAPRCTVGRCTEPEHRMGRCAKHYLPLRNLVATMAGAERGLHTSRRAFSQAMNRTTMRPERWADLADYNVAGADAEVAELLNEATDALYAAGYYVGVGPRGGRYLANRADRMAVAQ